MACDYEFGKFTFLDDLEPIQIPEPCNLEKKPEILEIDMNSQEIIDPSSLSIPSSPNMDKGIPEGVKRRTNGLTYDVEFQNKKLAITEYLDFSDGTESSDSEQFDEEFDDAICEQTVDIYTSKQTTNYIDTQQTNTTDESPQQQTNTTDEIPQQQTNTISDEIPQQQTNEMSDEIPQQQTNTTAEIPQQQTNEMSDEIPQQQTNTTAEIPQQQTNEMSDEIPQQQTNTTAEIPQQQTNEMSDEIPQQQTNTTAEIPQQQTNKITVETPQQQQTNKITVETPQQQQTNKITVETPQQQTNKSIHETPKQQTNKITAKTSKQQTNKSRNTSTEDGHICHWFTCEMDTGYATLETLYDHVLADHILPCEGQDIYMCQWDGCKIFDVPSSSYNGFKGHVLGHTKAKMYRCLIDECPASFRTIEGLAHHMEMQDNHFIISSENKKHPKSKQNIKSKQKSKPQMSTHTPSIKTRPSTDSFSPMRRSRRLHHTPSFKRYFIDQDSDEEETSKPAEFLHAPALLGIQRQAELMTSCDLLQSMREQSSVYNSNNEESTAGYTEEFVDKCLVGIRERDLTNFQVLGQRMLEESPPRVEYLCGYSKILLDWIASNTLPDFIQSSLSISIPDSPTIHNVLRMRTNKRK